MNETTIEENPNKITVKWVHIGREFFHQIKGKPFIRHGYRPVESADRSNSTYWFTAPVGSPKRSTDTIGVVYEGEISKREGNGITAYNFGSWYYRGRLEDHLDKTRSYDWIEQLSVQWKATETAHMAAYKAYKNQMANKARNPMYEALEPIRNAYSKTNTQGRQAILAAVIEYLSR